MTNDIQLRQAVLAKLEFDPEFDATALNISIDQGIVTLQGLLHDGQERAAAEHAVKLVPGVRGLVSLVKTELPETQGPNDEQLAARVLDALAWLTTIPPQMVTVDVRDGWVTLSGVVDSWHQRQTLEDIVRQLPPTRGVNNLLKLSNASPLSAPNDFIRAA